MAKVLHVGTIDNPEVLYRIFIQDVGRSGYSGYGDVRARSEKDAMRELSLGNVKNANGWPKTDGQRASRAMVDWNRLKRGPLVIAISHNDKDLWPDGKTGLLPRRSKRA